MSGAAWLAIALALMGVLIALNYRAVLRILRIRRGGDDDGR